MSNASIAQSQNHKKKKIFLVDFKWTSNAIWLVSPHRLFWFRVKNIPILPKGTKRQRHVACVAKRKEIWRGSCLEICRLTPPLHRTERVRRRFRCDYMRIHTPSCGNMALRVNTITFWCNKSSWKLNCVLAFWGCIKSLDYIMLVDIHLLGTYLHYLPLKKITKSNEVFIKRNTILLTTTFFIYLPYWHNCLNCIYLLGTGLMI